MGTLKLISLLLLHWASLASAQINFSDLRMNRADYPAGSQPYYVATASLRNNGRQDVIVANRSAGTVSVFLNNGDGTFAPRVDYASGAWPQSLAIADFNSDSCLDVAVANFESASIATFLGRRIGTQCTGALETPIYTDSLYEAPGALAAGDFTGDGKQDLAVTSPSDNIVTILVGNDDGSFTQYDFYFYFYDTGINPNSIVAADFTGDGLLDLAIANAGSPYLTILIRQNGDEGLFYADEYAIPSPANWITSRDLNGDGRPDLATANYDNGVNVLLNTGNPQGLFTTATVFPSGPAATTIVSADFNQDGRLDLLVTNQTENTVSILPGVGNGTFQAPVSFPVGAAPVGVAAADFNNDNHFDLVTGNYTANTISVLLQQPKPILESLQPNTAHAGSPSFTLTVQGTNIVPNTRIEWDGTPLPTIVDSPTSARATIASGMLNAAGVIPVQLRTPSNALSNVLNFTITGITPSITNITPPTVSAGSPQTVFTVDGSGFEIRVTALWNGTPVTTAFFSPTRAFVTIPANLLQAPGTAQLQMRNPTGPASAPRNISITGAGPTITSLTPNTAPLGSPAIPLTVKGTNFQNGALIVWNGAQLTTTFVDPTTLTATIPATLLTAAGAFPVIVRNPDNLSSSPVNFQVTASTPPPTLTSLNPSTIPQGSAAFTLILNGANFQPGATARWNGTNLQTTLQSAAQLSAGVPANLLLSAVTASIDVRNSDGQSSNALPFQVTAVTTPAPVLTSLNPSSVNATPLSFALTLNGLNFTPGATVLYNGFALTPTSNSPTQLIVTVTAGLAAFPGAANIQVRNADNQTSNILALTVRQNIPLITSISPLAAMTGATEVTLTVTGQNFLPGATVLWNGLSLPTTSPSTGQLAAMIPNSLLLAPGNATVSVRNPDGQTSAGVPFQIIAPPPVLSSINPSSATVGSPAHNLSLRGSGFRPGAQVKWNGSGLSTAYISATELSATLPAEFLLAEHTASIFVLNPDGIATNSIPFQVLPSLTPEITQLTPSSAPSGSSDLTMGVSGRNFVSGARVHWNGTPLATAYTSSTQLSATVPAVLLATTSVAGVAVRNPDGKTSAAALFAIGESLRITSSAALPPAVTGAPYEFAFTAAGGARPYRWRIASGNLPPGLTLATGGLLSGSPTQSGEFRLDIEVSDATNSIERQTATLTIDSADLDITSTSPLPPATAGAAYSYQMRVNARAATKLQWSIIEGALPAGLVLDASTGEISGIAEEPPDPATSPSTTRAASVPVRFQFRIQVSAAARNSSRKSFDLTVLPATGQFRITTASPLPPGSSGRPYRFQINAVAGTVPYTFTLAGSLPPGVAFSPDGILEGVPTQSGQFTFSVTARDAQQRTASQTYSWTVGPPAGPVITSGPLLPLQGLGAPADLLIEATDGVRPYTWSVFSGQLPPGIAFDPATGRLAGTARAVGMFHFSARVTDANGATDTRSLAIAVTSTGAPLQMLTQSLDAGLLGRAYAATLSAGGGAAPYRWSIVSGNLPAGLRLTGAQIEGTPTATGSFPIALRLTDAFGYSITRDFLLRINIQSLPAVQITGLADQLNPGQQSAAGVALAEAYAADIAGRLLMDFAPNPAVAGIDPALQFNSGGRTADFRIPAGQTTAVFAIAPAVQTGTVAGTITFRLELSVAGQRVAPANLPDRAVRIVHLPPVISSATLTRRTGGFDVTITGFATTREMGELVADATPATGRQLQTTRYIVPLTDVFRAWYASPQSLPFGTQFTLTVPFAGDASAIQSLTIRLRNSAGESASRTLN